MFAFCQVGTCHLEPDSSTDLRSSSSAEASPLCRGKLKADISILAGDLATAQAGSAAAAESHAAVQKELAESIRVVAEMQQDLAEWPGAWYSM